MSTKLNLKFTARDVAAVEEALDGSLEKIIASFKLTTLIQFLMVGLRDNSGNRLNLDEDKTFDIVDEKIKEFGKIELQIQVIDALIEAGFYQKPWTPNSSGRLCPKRSRRPHSSPAFPKRLARPRNRRDYTRDFS